MKRMRFVCRGLVVALPLVLLVMAGGNAMAAGQAARVDDGRWMPWLGCWELTNGRVGDLEQEQDADRQVCLTPADEAPGALLTTWVDGEEVLSERLQADGSRQPVQQGGCEGWKEARFSDDGQRLFTRSSLVCQGQHRREVTGLSLIDPSGRWLDIEVVEADGRRELMVRRYRFAGGETGSQDLALAAATARTGAGGSLDVEDVVEALEHVDAAAVEAALLETDATFDVDAELLLYLDDAGVPGQIVDLMVALSFPDYFVVDDGTGTEVGRGMVGLPIYAYGYWSPFFAPFGYGAYYYSPVRPVYGVGGVRPVSFGGRVIQGRGYTRVRARPGVNGGFGRLLRGGSSGIRSGGRDSGSSGNGGTVTPGGHSRGGGSGRTAKPRGEGSGDGRG